MNGSRRNDFRTSIHRLLRRSLAAVLLIVSSAAIYSPPPASATELPYRIDLRVLVLDDNSAWVNGIESQMQVEGVPYSTFDISTADITSTFLTGTANLSTATRALYQAVVVPDAALALLSTGERATLRTFEARFGIRQVDAWDSDINAYAAIGLGPSTFDGDLQGATANVTAAGKSAGFGYLDGPLPFSVGSWTHLAQPLAGANFTTLVESQPPAGGTTGVVIGVYSNGGVEQLVITAAFSFELPQFKYLAHGIITWMTRGVHFGYNRNNFTFNVDDAFANVALWDPAVDCTPGEDCTVGTARSVRMSVEDVAYAVAWMQANDYQLTLAFNGWYAYNDDGDGNPDPDPLADALRASQASFRWLNHGSQHLYQGCQQTDALPWACIVDALSQPVWVTEQTILDEINNNIATGVALGLTFDPAEYLSGEHSGLAHNLSTDPVTQQHGDNPEFFAAMTDAEILYIGTDASREAGSRQVGSAITIPRHPTALYYNTSTQADAVDEYNHIYTLSLDLATGFTTYIIPTDANYDLSFILSNDPRPFYAHTSNLTGDRLAYYLLDTILGKYRSVFTSQTPLVNLTLTQAATELARQQQWATDVGAVTGYVQNGVVSISNSTGHVVPFTAPAGTTIAGSTLESYGGESSAWLSSSSTTGTLPPTSLTTTGNVFVIGQAGTATVAASGVPAATVSATPVTTLPTGLALAPVQGGVTVTGTPAAGTEGQYDLEITTISAGRYVTDRIVTLTVTRRPVITSASSALAIVGQPFAFTFSSDASPTAVVTTSGALPAGITFTDLGGGSARLTGTPSSAAAGTYSITVTATNLGSAGTQVFALTVASTPEITSDDAELVLSGVPFSVTVSTQGYPAPAITKTGVLPAGVTFTDNGTGTATLAGTASKGTAGQTFPLTITATNAAGLATQAFSLEVSADYMSLVSTTPARLADTRPGSATVDHLYEGEGIRATGSTMELVVAGRGGVPADAAAVALNVTVAEPVGGGYVTVFPCGSDQPLASNLNYTAGAVVPNAVIAKIGDGGKVCLFVSNSTQLIVDVNGYFPATSSFSSMNPARILDTRPGYTTVDGSQQGDGIRGRNAVTTLQVTGRAGVPADASAVVLNVTVTEAEGPGFVTVYPCGTAIPTASNINFGNGSTVANMVIAKIGVDGSVCIYNNESTHVVVDVNGYFPALTYYRPLDPARLLDTRQSPELSTIDGQYLGAGLLSQNTVTGLVVSNRGGVPADASTVVLNVTVTEPTVPGFITVYPCGMDVPLASNLNYEVGSTVAIAVIVQVPADGTVCLYNSSPTQLIVDVNGYILK